MKKFKNLDITKCNIGIAHTAIFSGPSSCGKTQKVLDLIEGEYRHHFEDIVILCPTLRWNSTYLERRFTWRDDYVFPIEPKGNLLENIKTSQNIKKLSALFSGEEKLFVVDDVIADGIAPAGTALKIETFIFLKFFWLDLRLHAVTNSLPCPVTTQYL